jgi:cell division protein FtsB
MVRRRYAKKEIALASGCILLAISTLTFYIWQQATLIDLGYRTSGLENRIASLKEEINKLETEKETLLAPNKVEKIARDALHLTDPREDQLIYEETRKPDNP